MRVGYIELEGARHPLCFSLAAAGELTDAFGDMENMEAALTSSNVSTFAKAVDTTLTVLMRAGRIRAQALGEELPPPLACRPTDLIGVNDKRAIIAIYSTIAKDSKTEVEVEGKNARATQGEELLRGCTTTDTKQD